MPRIGLFGLMASGKSTLSRWFQEWGAAVVDGDVLGWEVLREPKIVAALTGAFGAGIAGRDGSIDRAALGRIVFRDRAAMERLNGIIQPRLLERVRRALDSAASAADGGTAPRAVLLDAALLTTWGLEPELDGVVEVRADEAAREGRLAAARRLDAEAARERIRGQRLPPVKNAKRHWIVQNDGDLSALRGQAEAVWKEIAALP